MAQGFVKVASVNDLRDGEMMYVTVNGDDVLLARVAGQFYAIHNMCPHAGGWLDQGTLHPETCEVECPLHEGLVDLRTGQPTAGPIEQPVRTYQVKVEGEDVLVGP